MAIFVDTNVVVALLNKRDRFHKRALAILNEISRNYQDHLVTNDYILDELVTTLAALTSNKRIVEKGYDLLMNTPEFITLHPIEHILIPSIYMTWKKYNDFPKRVLSFTDCSIIAQQTTLKVKYLISFDNGFKGIIPLIQ